MTNFPTPSPKIRKMSSNRFFEEADQLFLSGQLAAAREVYASLFRLMENPDDENDEADYHRHSAFPRELDSVIAASGRLH